MPDPTSFAPLGPFRLCIELTDWVGAALCDDPHWYTDGKYAIDMRCVRSSLYRKRLDAAIATLKKRQRKQVPFMDVIRRMRGPAQALAIHGIAPHPTVESVELCWGTPDGSTAMVAFNVAYVRAIKHLDPDILRWSPHLRALVAWKMVDGAMAPIGFVMQVSRG